MFFVIVGGDEGRPDRYVGPFLRLAEATDWAVDNLGDGVVFAVRRMFSPVEWRRPTSSRSPDA